MAASVPMPQPQPSGDGECLPFLAQLVGSDTAGSVQVIVESDVRSVVRYCMQWRALSSTEVEMASVKMARALI